jgi:hypothetical protein
VLHEIKNVKQERGGGSRRWFESDGLHLVVWLDPSNTVTGFQICYDLGKGEYALTWRAEQGFAHHAIDQGDETPLKNASPVLVADGSVPWSEVRQLFDRRSGDLEAPLQQLVRTKLAEYSRASAH